MPLESKSRLASESRQDFIQNDTILLDLAFTKTSPGASAPGSASRVPDATGTLLGRKESVAVKRKEETFNHLYIPILKKKKKYIDTYDTCHL